jgi:hypothetical protein
MGLILVVTEKTLKGDKIDTTAKAKICLYGRRA